MSGNRQPNPVRSDRLLNVVQWQLIVCFNRPGSIFQQTFFQASGQRSAKCNPHAETAIKVVLGRADRDSLKLVPIPGF
jgi:hypothetical protein